MQTVTRELIKEAFNGKVKVYKVKQFSDDRGMVSEVFRLDDEELDAGKMCYISETNPFVMRGAHQHENQTDYFVSWKNHMMYLLYDEEVKEMFHFITDPNEIYIIKVAPPIIHGYRNLEQKPMNTMNFPTSLFMGEGKKEEIDEIRHEPQAENNDTIVVLGAGGRLGSAMVDSLCTAIGYYNTDIIPVYDKIESNYDFEQLFNNLESVVKTSKVMVINCAAILNDNIKSQADYHTANIWLPTQLASNCKERDWDIVHFSTDYVFRKSKGADTIDKHSNYSVSKIMAEEMLIRKDYKKTTILRVANLFSTKESDTNNLIHKLWNSIQTNKEISVEKDIIICPTDVKCITDQIAPLLIGRDESIIENKLSSVNLVPENTYTVEELLKEFYNFNDINKKDSEYAPWFDEFNSGKKLTIYNSKQSIIDIINRLQQGDTNV